LLVSASLIALTFGVARVARAGSFIWVGNGSSGNANAWGNALNWNPNTVPSTNDDVTVDGTVQLNMNTGSTITVHSIAINATYTGSVNQTSSPLHVTTTFQMAGGTFSASTANAVQVDGAMTVSGGTFGCNGGATTATGGLTVSGTGTFNSNTAAVTLGGVTISGTGTFTGNGATVSMSSLSQSGGTFTGNTATITDTGGVSLTGGTFTASSGRTLIAGAFSHAVANTFNNNSGTFVFNATSSQSHTFGGASMPTVIINDGLAGYWNLDDGAGNPADSSGYGNTLTRSSALTWATTVPSTISFTDPDMVTFSGTYASNTAPTAMPAANAAQTISLWAQFASSSSTQGMLALNGSSSAVVLGLGGGNVRVWKNSGADLAHVTAPTDGNWHHIAFTTTGASDTLYVDGVATSGLGVGHDAGAVTSVYLGAAGAGVSQLSGSLDDVRVYTRALSAREVADLAFGHMPGTGAVTHNFVDAFTTANNNDLVLATGIVAGSAAVTVGGNWLNYGGRFTGTGAVTLNSGSVRTLLSAGQVFTNLTISAAGKITTSDRLWMTGQTLNLTVGATFGPAFPVHLASISDSTAGHTGLASGSGTGYVVLDSSSSQALIEKNFFGLRIEDPTETGIVGYWKLDEGQSTTARDVSGNGNTGTLSASGSTWTNPPGTITFDDAAGVKLDGTGYVTLGATGLPAANAAETISVWVKLGSTSGTQDFIALGDGAGHGVKLGLNGGTLAAFTWAGTSLVTGTTPVDGAWHNVVYSYDGVGTNNLYVDGVAVSPTGTAHQSGSTTVAYLGTYDGSNERYNGSIDDVRVYNTALTAAQVGQISKGRYAGTGGVATVTQTTVALNVPLGDFGLVLDSGNYDTNDQTVTVSVTTMPCIVNSGTLHIGSKVVNCDGGLTINPLGTLSIDTSGGQFQPGKNSTVAIDGTFNASNGALISRDNNGETYSFQIGTFSGSKPVLNITNLEIRFTDVNGVQIDNLAGVATGATTSYTHFDNVLFRQAPAGGLQMLEIYSNALYLSSSGCTFGKTGDTNIASTGVKLIGNGTGDGETRVVFGSTACQAKSGGWTGGGTDTICLAAAKSDDDSDGNGIADSGTALTNGAVVQFVRAAEDDTAGSVVGLPTSAFDWNNFKYYSTYVAFHNAASGSSDVIYVRDELGNPLYSWTVPTAGETISGTPQWNSVKVAGVTTHYLYVATNAGKIYRLIDTATGTTSGTLSPDTTNAPWSTTNPFNCSCAISTPLGMDANNLYWGSTTSGKNFWTLGQSTQSNPTPISISQAVTNTGISVATIGATSYAFMGVAGAVLQISTAGNAISATNSSPNTHSVLGRIAVGLGATNRVYAGDDGGTMWAIDPTSIANFGHSGGLWSYNTANAIQSSPYYDTGTDSVQYGTQGGTIIVLGASGAVLNSGYPYTPAGGSGDAIQSAPLYYNGILAIGSTGGKLYFLDRQTGTSPAVSIVREYSFGSSETVSGIGFDPTANRYMVSTANSSTKDGRLYYIDLITDPTPSFL
jgi:hypothetical protein